MKISSKFLSYFKLDQSYSLLNCRHVSVLLEFFKALDVRGVMALDDIQFVAFMRSCTDLSKNKIYRVFDMLDVDHSGLIDFDEFYVLICILLAVRYIFNEAHLRLMSALPVSNAFQPKDNNRTLTKRDKQEKDFIVRHSQTVFELMDEDGSCNISAKEFEGFSFLFNFEVRAVKQIFDEFDVSGKQKLDYQEFRLFIVACIDRQVEIEQKRRQQMQERGLIRRWCYIQ